VFALSGLGATTMGVKSGRWNKKFEKHWPIRSYRSIKALVMDHYLFSVKTICLHGESGVDGLNGGWMY